MITGKSKTLIVIGIIIVLLMLIVEGKGI